jgi:hypothetical protein
MTLNTIHGVVLFVFFTKETYKRSKMTLNFWMMVERYPNLKEEVGGSIPGCEISSLLGKKTCKVVNYLMCFGPLFRPFSNSVHDTKYHT